jgi:hypothetical protein
MKTNHHQPEELQVFPAAIWSGDVMISDAVIVVDVGEWAKVETEAEKVY